MSIRSTFALGAAFFVASSSSNARADLLSATSVVNQNATVDNTADHHPSAAMDAMGRLIAVWTSTATGDAEIMFARSTDNGMSWSAPAAIAPSPNADRGASVVTDGAGVWIVAWQSRGVGDSEILFSRSTDHGLNWSAPALLTASPDFAEDTEVRVATDRNGMWMAVWSSRFSYGFDQDILAVRSVDGGVTWSAPVPVDVINAPQDLAEDMRPAIASDEAGLWIAAWTTRNNGSDSDLLYARSTDGLVWTPSASLNTNAALDSGDDDAVDLAADGTGNWLASWHSFEPNPWGGDGDILTARSALHGAIWSVPDAVYSFSLIELGRDMQPRINTDRNGRWSLVWWREDSLPGSPQGDVDVLQARSNDVGNSWVGPELINRNALNDSGDDYSPVVVTNRIGSWVVLWYSDDTLSGSVGTDYDIFSAYAVCGDGVQQLWEQCDDGNLVAGDCCSPACVIEPALTLCRPAAGSCDVAEVCSGVTPSCPADTFAPSTVLCRAETGACNPADFCDGASADCPIDAPAPPAVLCRASSGVCDSAEYCDGAADECPTDGFAPANTLCRPAADICDVPESCTGASAVCPADSFVGAGTECRSSAGICDVAESCSGAAAACPADSFVAAGTICRSSAGVCDVTESCSGFGAACPVDGFAADGTFCTNGLTCDGTEQCFAGSCGAGTVLSCDDGDACTAEFCSEPGGCGSTPIAGCCNADVECDDGNACTVETCSGPGGVCTSVAIPNCCNNNSDCNDGNSCTTDVCSGPGGSCVASPITNCCTADADCTAPACGSASCDSATARCVVAPVAGCCTSDADCGDGNSCTTESCDVATGACVWNAVEGCCASAGDCDDGDACTADACGPAGCTHDPIPGCCASDADCSSSNACMAASCDSTTQRCVETPVAECCTADSDCSAARPCSAASCDVAANTCVEQAVPNCCAVDGDCDDNDPNTVDRCFEGTCRWTPIDQVDAGPGADAGGPSTDAGNTSDAGVSRDAGNTSDAGNGADAGNTIDAGHTIDAGNTADAGVAADAANTSDAGNPKPGMSGSADIQDLNFFDDDGCECSSVKVSRNTSPLWVLALGAVLLFRRKKKVLPLVAAAVLVSSVASAQPHPNDQSFEVGASAGAFLPSSRHELYDSSAQKHAALGAFGLDLSLRAAFFPLAYLGGEVEGGMMPMSTITDRNVYVYTARAHAIVQIPGRITPFILAGGGVLGLQSGRDAVGSDRDPAFHWGAGAKLAINDTVSVRLDLRHVMSAGRGPNEGNVDHFEVLGGLSFTLWKSSQPPMRLPEPVPAVEPIFQPVEYKEVEPLPVSRDFAVPEVVLPEERVEAALERMHFEWGSAEIRSADHPTLGEAVRILTDHPQLKVQIFGHADSTGGERWNLILSRLRAKNVATYLMEKGVEPERIEAFGMGEGDPVAPNDTREGRAQNRRIEFNVVDPNAPLRTNLTQGAHY